MKTSEGPVTGLATVVPLFTEPSEDFTPRGVSLSELLHIHAKVKFGTYRRSTIRNHLRTRKLLRLCQVPEHPSKLRLQAWAEQLRGLGLSDGDVDLQLRNLSVIYKVGNEFGAVAGNPVALMHKRRINWAPNSIERIRERWPEFLAVAEGPLERAFLGVLRFAGLRKGEALGLLWSDLTVPRHLAKGPNWNHEEVRAPGRVVGKAKRAKSPEGQLVLASGYWLSVTKQRQVGVKQTEGPPKTEGSKRRLPVRAPLADLLLPLAKGSDGIMFPFGKKRLDRVARALREVDPKAFTAHPFHAFRHTVALEMVERGLEVREIARFLGHSSTRATERYLANLTGAPVPASVIEGLD